MRIAELHNIFIDELFGRNNPLESKLESIKVALADLPAEKQQEALDNLIDYTYFIKNTLPNEINQMQITPYVLYGSKATICSS